MVENKGKKGNITYEKKEGNRNGGSHHVDIQSRDI